MHYKEEIEGRSGDRKWKWWRKTQAGIEEREIWKKRKREEKERYLLANSWTRGIKWSISFSIWTILDCNWWEAVEVSLWCSNSFSCVLNKAWGCDIGLHLHCPPLFLSFFFPNRIRGCYLYWLSWCNCCKTGCCWFLEPPVNVPVSYNSPSIVTQRTRTSLFIPLHINLEIGRKREKNNKTNLGQRVWRGPYGCADDGWPKGELNDGTDVCIAWY